MSETSFWSVRMFDQESLAGWQPTYEDWAATAKSMIFEGKAKEAFGAYPWFTTQGDRSYPRQHGFTTLWIGKGCSVDSHLCFSQATSHSCL